MPNAYSVTTCSLYTESDTDVPMCEHSSTLLRACHMLCCSVVCLHGLWCGVLCVLATSLLCASYKAHAMVLEKYGGVRRITEDYDCEFEHFSTLLRACHMLCCSVVCRPWPTKPETTGLPSKPSCGRMRDSETAPTYVKVTRGRLDAPPYTLCPFFGFRARVNK